MADAPKDQYVEVSEAGVFESRIEETLLIKKPVFKAKLEFRSESVKSVKVIPHMA